MFFNYVSICCTCCTKLINRRSNVNAYPSKYDILGEHMLSWGRLPNFPKIWIPSWCGVLFDFSRVKTFGQTRHKNSKFNSNDNCNWWKWIVAGKVLKLLPVEIICTVHMWQIQVILKCTGAFLLFRSFMGLPRWLQIPNNLPIATTLI